MQLYQNKVKTMGHFDFPAFPDHFFISFNRAQTRTLNKNWQCFLASFAGLDCFGPFHINPLLHGI
jgi:hypothetical protein